MSVRYHPHKKKKKKKNCRLKKWDPLSKYCTFFSKKKKKKVNIAPNIRFLYENKEGVEIQGPWAPVHPYSNLSFCLRPLIGLSG